MAVFVTMTTRLCDKRGHPVKFVAMFLRGPSVVVMQFDVCCGCFDPFFCSLVSEDNRGDDVQTVQPGSFSCFSFFLFLFHFWLPKALYLFRFHGFHCNVALCGN